MMNDEVKHPLLIRRSLFRVHHSSFPVQTAFSITNWLTTEAQRHQVDTEKFSMRILVHHAFFPFIIRRSFFRVHHSSFPVQTAFSITSWLTTEAQRHQVDTEKFSMRILVYHSFFPFTIRRSLFRVHHSSFPIQTILIRS
jgi:uncharacterized membrane protein